MTENPKFFPERPPTLSEQESTSQQESTQSPELPVTLELPLEIANAIAQRMGQSGQTQVQVILETLAMSLQEKELEEKSATYLLEELEQMKRRIAELETLIPQVALLQGKSIAF